MSSLAIFFFAKTVGMLGEGTLIKTKSAVHCAALSTIPIAFFTSTFIGNAIFGSLRLFFNISSLLSVLVLSVYSFSILVLTLSEMYKIKVVKALPIAIFGLTITALVGGIALLLLRNFV
jgi:hypothetical protein